MHKDELFMFDDGAVTFLPPSCDRWSGNIIFYGALLEGFIILVGDPTVHPRRVVTLKIYTLVIAILVTNID